MTQNVYFELKAHSFGANDQFMYKSNDGEIAFFLFYPTNNNQKRFYYTDPIL